MKTILAFLMAGSALFATSCTNTNNYDKLVFPNPSEPIKVALAIPSEGDLISARIPESDTGLIKSVKNELMIPFHKQLIRVSQCARNLAGNTEGPNLLLLSENEGGFPRTGIKLVSDSAETTYPDLNFVDLVIDQRGFERGDLSIYSHELGHVMMNLILTTYWDRFPNPTSPKQHVSMGVTDYLTAFYEGWGVSFQRLAYDNVKKYRTTFHDGMDIKNGLRMAWHSNMDEYLRVMKVEDNGYIYEKSPVDLSVWDTLNNEQRILLEHTSNQFNIGKIKNAQQMLSCEGFVATLFYQLNSSEILQKQYVDREVYQKFLIGEIPEGSTPKSMFRPLENVLLKNMVVWNEMNNSQSTEPPVIDFIQTWARIFPDDAKEVISTFILLSRGATLSSSLPALVEKANIAGQMGDIGLFRKYSGDYMSGIQEEIQNALVDPGLLSCNIGYQLWIQHPTLLVRRALWMPEPKAPFAINLNTAGFAEISSFIGEEKAVEFIRLRREKGHFESLDEIHYLGFKFEQ
jgi:hypothetical protein